MKKNTASKKPTKIIRHICHSPYQDEKYGPCMRLANATKILPGNIYRCTVCGQLE